MKEELYYGCTREWINNFIIKVFNYYNGKINSFNRCTLEIEWAEKLNSKILGQTQNPNMVVIYPKVILRGCKTFPFFIYMIIHVVIHELHHADQFILYTQMGDNEQYTFSIEAPVVRETAKYILSHLDEIEWLSDNIVHRSLLDLDSLYEESISNLSYDYFKRDIRSHIVMGLTEILGVKYGDRMDAVLERINECMEGKKNLIIEINGLRYMIIASGNIVTDVDMFNSFIRYEYFGKTVLTSHSQLFEGNRSYIIKINSNNKDLMCTM